MKKEFVDTVRNLKIPLDKAEYESYNKLINPSKHIGI
jgi:hypothetical protein